MKALTWRSVSGGIAALAAILVLLVLVLVYARTGVLRGDKFRLFVAVPDATNVLTGTEVWLNGQRVGTVTSIDFAPASAPLHGRVIIGTEILASMRDQIRLDSKADLRSGGTIIGAPVVSLGTGTMAARAVHDGDTLHGVGQSDFEMAASRATEALEEVPGILANAKIVMANARASGARLETIVHRGGPRSFAEQSGALARKLSDSRGSFARFTRDASFRQRVSRTMAASDTLRTLLASRAAELGRFRRDSTLARSVERLRNDVATLRTMASSPDGTVGRITTDSAIYRGLDSLFAELSALMADIKKNPVRYSRVV
jgi:phospholipid/cholesterol/gamma-HCH transport system substrate-binding protein